MKLAKSIVKHKVPILIICLFLLILSVFGIAHTRINYDMLDYIPADMDTVVGQYELKDEFGKGAFSFIVVKNMEVNEVASLRDKIEEVDHVDTALWYSSIMDLDVPIEMLPDEIYEAFNTDDATMIAVFFDTATSADETIQAIKDIRLICDERCFVSGMSALVTDLKDLCEQEEPLYVGIAVSLATIAMILLLDGWLIPIVFLLSIGIAILINLGSNILLGEISYITKALSAVLQLAVTMDYSIFLWNSYNEELKKDSDKNNAMTKAISETFSAIIGSSTTTIAGFIALCFMSFTLGKDIGIVMAKGVLLGVISCVTLLPSLILLLDKPLQKTRHKSLIPDMSKLSQRVVKVFPVFLVIFVLLAVPAFFGYSKTNDEVYYDLGQCLPEDIDYVIANTELKNEFDIASTHMVLASADLDADTLRNMMSEMEDVPGIKYVLGLESIVGPMIPEEMIPESIVEILRSDKWNLILVNSEYKVASDNVNNQIEQLNSIIKKYDESGMIIGEAPCMKDMIDITAHDFKVVNTVSILAIFVIILIVTKSITLPVILISVIEMAIFINLGLPHYLGQSLPFIAPICISTIQLGATVDYAILLTTRYKKERIAGNDKQTSITVALKTAFPSVIVSGLGLFSATFGVALYSDIDIISSMCMLMARGAIISMLCVLFILPALIMLLDKVIVATTIDMKVCKEIK